ncbi:MAG: hypothetical protein HY964_00140 [Ignavibacteriales bacterium]|nr:hypothetical protein [Ignavibacteriales bacterium]
MKTLILFLFLSLVIFNNGCFNPNLFMSGDKSEIYDEKGLTQLSRVALMPVSVSPSSEKSNVNTGPITDSLWNEIKAKKIFSLIPMDSLNLAAENMSNNDSLTALQLTQALSADAYIDVEIIYLIPPSYGKTYTSALFLSFHDSNSGKMLAFFCYDTFKGNTYIIPPRLAQVTSDAIKGMSALIAKKLNQLRGKH